MQDGGHRILYIFFGDLILYFERIQIFYFLFRINPMSISVDSYHPSLLLSIEVDLCLTPIIDCSFGGERRFNFHRMDFSRLNTLLPSVDWSSVLISPPYNSLSLHRILVGFYDVLFKYFRECAPFVSSRLERSGPSFNSVKLSRLRNRKSRLFKKFVNLLFTLGQVWIIIE